MFCKMIFFVLFEEWAETPQCDVSTDIMTVRSYFLQKELDFLSSASILVLSSDILVDGVQRNVCHPILFLESFHGKSKTFKFWMFFNKLI